MDCVMSFRRSRLAARRVESGGALLHCGYGAVHTTDDRFNYHRN